MTFHKAPMELQENKAFHSYAQNFHFLTLPFAWPGKGKKSGKARFQSCCLEETVISLCTLRLSHVVFLLFSQKTPVHKVSKNQALGKYHDPLKHFTAAGRWEERKKGAKAVGTVCCCKSSHSTSRSKGCG